MRMLCITLDDATLACAFPGRDDHLLESLVLMTDEVLHGQVGRAVCQALGARVRDAEPAQDRRSDLEVVVNVQATEVDL